MTRVCNIKAFSVPFILIAVLLSFNCSDYLSPFLAYDAVVTNADAAWYSSLDHNSIPVRFYMDIYEPSPDNRSGRDLVILLHGGSFSGGYKAQENMLIIATELARRGFVCASIDYRLWGAISNIDIKDAGIAAAYDAQTATRYFKANSAAWDIDPDKITLMGNSAGALASVYAGLHPNDNGTDNTNYTSWPSTVKAIVSISGGLYPGISFYDKNDSAADRPDLLMLFHGKNDLIVPSSCSINAKIESDKIGLNAELFLYPFLGHPLEGSRRQEIIDTFYYYYMKK